MAKWFSKFRKKSSMILRLLKTIADFTSKTGRDPYTREVLTWLKTWGYGHKILKLAESLGLVYRYESPHPVHEHIICIYNALTQLGEKILKILNQEDETEDEEEPP